MKKRSVWSRNSGLLVCAAPALAALLAAQQYRDRPRALLFKPGASQDRTRISLLPTRTQPVNLGDAAAPARRPQVQLDAIIGEASRRFAIPEAWIRSVIHTESRGRATEMGRPLASSAGAIGIMQLMRNTYIEMSSRYGLGSDPSDVHDNVFAGTAYLRELYKRYGYPSLFGAYNAGPARMENYLMEGAPLPSETITYIKLVTRRIGDAGATE